MHQNLHRRAVLGSSLGAGLGWLAGCGGANRAKGVVNVYSARHYDSDRVLMREFEEQSGIAVRVLTSGGDQLLSRLQTEGDQTAADLIVAADAGGLFRLKDAHLLQPVSTPALLQAAPERYRDPDGDWWPIARRARVIVYAKDRVDPASIVSMDDLADARWRGKVCARSSTNPYNLSLLAARIAREGEAKAKAWAAGVHANFASGDLMDSDIAQIRAVAAGQCDVAISNHYYYMRLVHSPDPADRGIGDKVGILVPDQGETGVGAHVNVSGAGVSAYAHNKAEAIQLLEFLLSKRAQEQIAPLNEEFPIRTDVALPPELAALGDFKTESVPLSALGQYQPEAAQIYESVGWR